MFLETLNILMKYTYFISYTEYNFFKFSGLD